MTFSSLGLQGAARRVATATVTAPNVIRGSSVQRHSWMRASQSLQLPKPSGLRPFSSQGALRDEQKPSPPPGMLTCSPHAHSIACGQMRDIDPSHPSSTVQAPMATRLSGAALFSTGRVVPVRGAVPGGRVRRVRTWIKLTSSDGRPTCIDWPWRYSVTQCHRFSNHKDSHPSMCPSLHMTR